MKHVTIKPDTLRYAHSRLNEKIIRNVNSLNVAIGGANHQHGTNIRKTNEWADSILKDLDNLILSNQRYTDSLSSNLIFTNQTTTEPPKSPHKRSTIINVVLRKTTPTTSPTSPIAPTAFASTPTNNLNKNQTAIITAAAMTKDNNKKISKPEKHVSGLLILASISLSFYRLCQFACLCVCVCLCFLSKSFCVHLLLNFFFYL